MGAVNYYNRFIYNFAQITTPIMHLLKKSIHFELVPGQQVAFDNLKQRLRSAPILQLPDFEKKFIAKTNARNVTIVAVLLQKIIITSYQQHTIAKRYIICSANIWFITAKCLQLSKLFPGGIATQQGMKLLCSQTTYPLSTSRDN